MTRFLADEDEFVDPESALPLMTTKRLLKRLGVTDATRLEQEVAVRDWLERNAPNEILGEALRREGFIDRAAAGGPRMRSVDDHERFLSDYVDYVRGVVVPARHELREILDSWMNKEYWAAHREVDRLPFPYPVQDIAVRIKRPESVLDKIRRKPSTYPAGESIESIRRMSDLLAGRVVVWFSSQLTFIDRHIRSSGLFELSPDRAPIAFVDEKDFEELDLGHFERRAQEIPVPQSLRYFVRLVGGSQAGERPYFELEVRTAVANLWAELEHLVGYEPNAWTGLEVRKRLPELVRRLREVDRELNALHDDLRRFQATSTYTEENPLNAENISAVLSSVGLDCSQFEIEGILSLLTSRGVRTVGDFKRRASESRLDVIRNVYFAKEQRPPHDFEVVATLAMIGEDADAGSIISATEANLAYERAWKQVFDEIKAADKIRKHAAG